MAKGKVYLVGAGPGDIGLLTLKGFKCLQRADVVVYDFHLNAEILNYISQSAEFIYAGKRGGHHTLTQEEINSILVQKAKEGKIVCRLKGGDPFVFGRGGEEALRLAEEGIEFEIVPGVSSAIAVPAYAGIPLTHRQYSSTFIVAPGNEDPTKETSTIDIEGLASGAGTLVFLMAVKNIEGLSKRLIKAGKAPETPTAVIRWGTRAEQTTIVGTLSDIAEKVVENDIKPPAVMVVGDVVKLRDKLKWFEKKPLFGHRILVTREHSSGFEELTELGAEVLCFPTIEIVPPDSWDELDRAIDKLHSYHWLILTSANGVRYFFERLRARGIDIRELKGIRLCAVGSKTKEEIESRGLKVDLVPEEFRAEGLIEAFRKLSGGNLRGVRFLLPRAERARELFPEEIIKMGAEIDTPTAYRAVKPNVHGKRLKRFLIEGRITVATFTSAATFNNFRDILGPDAEELLKGVLIAVIGPVTKKAIERAGLSVDIMPDEATVEALSREIIKKLTTPDNLR